MSSGQCLQVERALCREMVHADLVGPGDDIMQFLFHGPSFFLVTQAGLHPPKITFGIIGTGFHRLFALTN